MNILSKVLANLNRFESIANLYNSRMVLLHYKKTDHNQFLFETLGTRPIGEIID